jgi:hypothetical protein
MPCIFNALTFKARLGDIVETLEIGLHTYWDIHTRGECWVRGSDYRGRNLSQCQGLFKGLVDGGHRPVQIGLVVKKTAGAWTSRQVGTCSIPGQLFRKLGVLRCKTEHDRHRLEEGVMKVVHKACEDHAIDFIAGEQAQRAGILEMGNRSGWLYFVFTRRRSGKRHHHFFPKILP